MSSTFEPKWTPGPWAWQKSDYLQQIDVFTLGIPGAFIADVPLRQGRGLYDAELIALAPELAAAVLEAAGEAECVPEHKRCYAENLCVALAERLRMIGADE